MKHVCCLRILLLLLGLLESCLIVTIWLSFPKNLVAFDGQKNHIVPPLSQEVLPVVQNICMEIKTANLLTSKDAWTIVIDAYAANNLEPDRDMDSYRLIWRDASPEPTQDVISLVSIESLPPLKVKFIFDLEQERLHADSWLQSEQQITEDKKFWHKYADTLVKSFQFTGDLFGDIGGVYYKSSLGSFSPCGINECLHHRSGISNTILDAAEAGYSGETKPLSGNEKEFFDDAWPGYSGQLVFLFTRWRSDSLGLSSYPFSDSRLAGKTVVIVVGRSSNMPEELETLRQDLDKKYGIGTIYIAAPPGTTDFERISDEIKRYFQSQRSHLALNARFKYLLDHETANNGTLQLALTKKNCASNSRSLDAVYLSKNRPSIEKIPNRILAAVLSAALSVTLQALLIGALLAYKLSPSFRDYVDSMADDRSLLEK